MMNFFSVVSLSIITGINLFFYERMVKNTTTLLINAMFNILAYLSIAIWSYVYEEEHMESLKQTMKFPFLIPYMFFNVLTILLWYKITKSVNASYVSIFEGTAVIFLILLNLFFVKDYNIDSKFIIGSLLVIIGVIVIQI